VFAGLSGPVQVSVYSLTTSFHLNTLGVYKKFHFQNSSESSICTSQVIVKLKYADNSPPTLCFAKSSSNDKECHGLGHSYHSANQHINCMTCTSTHRKAIVVIDACQQQGT